MEKADSRRTAIEKPPKYANEMKINERRPADGKCGQIYAINFVVEGCDPRHSGLPRGASL
jgi:hypothetical protein